MLKLSKLTKKTLKTSFLKRSYFGNELPNFAALGIAEENRCDPWSGIDTSRASLTEYTTKYQPIVHDSSQAGRLTTELYSRAILADKLHNNERYTQAVENDMANLEKVINHRYFQTILGNVGESPLSVRQQRLDEAMTDMNAHFITRYFFAYLLVEKKRTKLIPSIFKIWNNYMREKKDIHEAKVVSAYEFTNEELEIVKDKIKRSVCTEKGILNFSFKVDKSLVAGFKVEVDGSVRDFSFSSQLSSWDRFLRDEQSKKDQFVSSIPKFIY